MQMAVSINRRTLAVAALLSSILSSVRGDRVWFADEGENYIEQDYEAHNIFVVNGTTLNLDGGYTITAPDSSDDGEDVVRVTDAAFNAINGKIYGGLGVGGSGVTISTTRDSDYPPGTATFGAGIEVYGGDATREKTTKGGDAVQVLSAGSVATFNGGRFVPGTGCTMKVCGTATGDGVALHVIQGEAIVQGGTFEGVFYNLGGDIELRGCVEFDKETGKITGVLLDGSEIDVEYRQPKGENRPPTIVYHPEVCPEEVPAPGPTPENGGRLAANVVALTKTSVVFVLLLLL